MKMSFYSRANKTHFHWKDFPLSFVLKERDLELENSILFIAVSHPEPYCFTQPPVQLPVTKTFPGKTVMQACSQC